MSKSRMKDKMMTRITGFSDSVHRLVSRIPDDGQSQTPPPGNSEYYIPWSKPFETKMMTNCEETPESLTFCV
jgi:hypothetical protein